MQGVGDGCQDLGSRCGVRFRRGYGGDMAGLGAPELIVVLIIVLVLFGGAKLPKLAKSLGQAQREFKKGTEDGAADDTASTDADSTPKGPVS